MVDHPETGGIQRAGPILKTGDYGTARDFYTSVLGFSAAEAGGNPSRFAILECGRAVVFLNGWHGAPAASEGCCAYLHVGDADALYRQVEAAGATVTRAHEDTLYGMREFERRDAYVNLLCFGADCP